MENSRPDLTLFTSMSLNLKDGGSLEILISLSTKLRAVEATF